MGRSAKYQWLRREAGRMAPPEIQSVNADLLNLDTTNDQVIKNHDFGQQTTLNYPPDGWKVYGSTVWTSDSGGLRAWIDHSTTFSGRNSIRCQVATGSTTAGLQTTRPIPIEELETLRGRIVVYGDATNATTIRINMTWLDVNGATLSTSTSTRNVPAAAWTDHTTAALTAPTTARFVTPSFEAVRASNDCTIYVDSFSLVRQGHYAQCVATGSQTYAADATDYTLEITDGGTVGFTYSAANDDFTCTKGGFYRMSLFIKAGYAATLDNFLLQGEYQIYDFDTTTWTSYYTTSTKSVDATYSVADVTLPDLIARLQKNDKVRWRTRVTGAATPTSITIDSQTKGLIVPIGIMPR